MGYRILGFVVWRGAKLVVRHKVNSIVSGRRLAAAGVVAAGIGGLIVVAPRRSG